MDARIILRLFLNEIITRVHNEAHLKSLSVLSAQCYGAHFANSLRQINPNDIVNYYGLSFDETEYTSFGNNVTINQQTLHPDLVTFILAILQHYNTTT